MHGPDLDDDEDDAWARPRDDEDNAWETTMTMRGPDLDDADEDNAWAKPR